MKSLLISASLVLATATAAQATEVFADPLLAAASSSQQKVLSDCLSDESSSRAVRACTKAIRFAPPLAEVQSQLYTRRGLHQLALGRFEDASDDFRRVDAMSGQDGLGTLGQGFAAMFNQDLDAAQARFAESAEQPTLAPLAEYGLGLTHEMAGDVVSARAAYERALVTRPGWDAVEDKLDALETE